MKSKYVLEIHLQLVNEMRLSNYEIFINIIRFKQKDEKTVLILLELKQIIENLADEIILYLTCKKKWFKTYTIKS